MDCLEGEKRGGGAVGYKSDQDVTCICTNSPKWMQLLCIKNIPTKKTEKKVPK